ncbi:hypothetical protein PG994_002195 [Apiospora phragmitis]|uniref:Uncharacterized protein n=1 Tax=Apiospora phragmitis TaxID=2905665 RepID=A0ABR1WVP5_9PEZI
MVDRLGTAEGDLFQPLDYMPKISGYLSRDGTAESLIDIECVKNAGIWSSTRPEQVFLILREHLGDENLDLAGGVLYEFIEIDCEYTDDPGAAFQRWRHDHMSRYTDLELPHVPHMTTITPCIIPTERLAHWRSQHPERYPFVLSDSGPPSSERFSGDRSCIRNRKAWLIDNTFYVSSKTGGTLPLNNPDPKEFHELQWKAQDTTGRLVEEREVPLKDNKWSRDMASRRASEARSTSSVQGDKRTPAPRSSLLNRLAVRFSRKRKDHVQEERRRSWLPSALMGEGGLSFKDWRATHNTTPIPLPEGCGVPHAIFARKNLLVDEEENLSSFAAVSQMPVAESKATDAVIEAASQSDLIGHEQPWRFRGPFTPQLGYDGGLDYQWTLCRRSLDSLRPTTRDARCKELEQGKGHKPRVASDSTTPYGACPTMGANRKKSHFGLDGVLEWLASSEHVSEELPSASTFSRLENFGAKPPTPPRVPPPRLSERPLNEHLRLASRVSAKPSSDTPPLFENIAFVMSGNRSEKHGPSSNRKATIIQLSPTLSSQYTSTSELHGSRRMCPVHKRSYLSFSSSTTRGESDYRSDDNIGCYDCAREAEGELLPSRPPIVCELLHPRPRLCGVSQGVTAERLRDLGIP